MTTGNGTEAATSGVSALPLGYRSLTPLLSERHGDLKFRRRRDFRFAEKLHAAPLAVEEFTRAHFHYPIVFTKTDPVLPVALLGIKSDQNDFIDDAGQWRDGLYIPSYIRRFPFALARENETSTRMLLCADLTAPNFDDASGEPDEVLFEGGEATDYAKSILDFCQKFEEAMAKTRRTCAHLQSLDLFDDAQVTIPRPAGQPVKVDGFRIVSEEKLRAVDDAALADLARRGVVGLIAAHHFSITQFTGLTPDQG